MIVAEGLSKHFGSVKALDAADLSIKAGEFFSLLGPSGCGKTTLLRLIAGFEQPTAGRLAIAGQSMAGVPANLRPTNMVFQSYAIFPHLDVRRNVAYGLRRARLDPRELDRRVGEALAMVDLSGYERREPHQLSGGQRQRVALARALVMRPKVLLLDEPLSALDKKLREAMQIELQQLQRAVGITFILVTHDQEEALTMSDRIAVMFDGRIAQVAPPRELYERPGSRRVAAFIGGMNFIEARLEGAAGGRLAVEMEAFGRLDLPRPAGFPDNPSSLTIGVRPERLKIVANGASNGGSPGSGGLTTRAGTVLDVHYYFGETTHYFIRVDGREEPLVVSVSNSQDRAEFETGQRVEVGFEPASLVPLA
ncbi:MAG: ATP-binding cassette domain-containing protein [Rhizobiales bacterium]|nr:ATP-binding cassette domain-containing protein [Hyphomicrobiales bacterium]